MHNLNCRYSIDGAASTESLAELVLLVLAQAELKQMSQFRLRNICISAVSGERYARLQLMTNPAVENADSQGTNVASMHKYLRARFASFGRWAKLS